MSFTTRAFFWAFRACAHPHSPKARGYPYPKTCRPSSSIPRAFIACNARVHIQFSRHTSSDCTYLESVRMSTNQLRVGHWCVRTSLPHMIARSSASTALVVMPELLSNLLLFLLNLVIDYVVHLRACVCVCSMISPFRSRPN